MKFTVYGTPRPQGSMRAFVRNGRAIVTSDNQRLKPWRQLVSDTLFVESGCIPYCGDNSESVFIVARFFFAKPKSAPKSRSRPTVRPDLDKLIRGILDAGTGILYGDDSQVVSVQAEKYYGTPERVEIEVDFA